MKKIKATIKYWKWYLVFQFAIRRDRRKTRNDANLQLIYKAMLYALGQHHAVRQKYDGYPYFFHLNEVAKNALRWKHLVSNDVNTYLGALFHDLIEDVHMITYNNVKEMWGVEVAEIVFACTELRGRNRPERHGDAYYELLRTTKNGTFVKVCDVIANMERGKLTGSDMFAKYRKEYPHFKSMLYREDLKEMFDYIENVVLK